jgi:protein TonB
MTADFADLYPFSTATPPERCAVWFFISLCVHLTALWLAFGLVGHLEARAAAREITAHLLPASPVISNTSVLPDVRPARSQPLLPAPMPQPQRKLLQPQVASAVQVPVTETDEAAPATISAEVAPTAAAAVTDAPFAAADYPQNPKPVYPLASRRLGEEGKVLLRVRVSVDGDPEMVEIKQSSGFVRRDQAAKAAVERWHFPARRGTETEAFWIVVPILFSLQVT